MKSCVFGMSTNSLTGISKFLEHKFDLVFKVVVNKFIFLVDKIKQFFCLSFMSSICVFFGKIWLSSPNRRASSWIVILLLLKFFTEFGDLQRSLNQRRINKNNNFKLKIPPIYKTFKVVNYFQLKSKTPVALCSNVVYRFSCSCDTNKTYIEMFSKRTRHTSIYLVRLLDIRSLDIWSFDHKMF